MRCNHHVARSRCPLIKRVDRRKQTKRIGKSDISIKWRVIGGVLHYQQPVGLVDTGLIRPFSTDWLRKKIIKSPGSREKKKEKNDFGNITWGYRFLASSTSRTTPLGSYCCSHWRMTGRSLAVVIDVRSPTFHFGSTSFLMTTAANPLHPFISS